MSIEELNYAQKQRLAYIDFKLMFVGYVTRAEVVSFFQLGVSSASRDINLYKNLAPKNMVYDAKVKKYFQSDNFKPVFVHDARRTLIKMAHQISDGFDAISDTAFPVESPSQLNVPDVSIIAAFTRAIINKRAIKVSYTSLSGGAGNREIVPHSIVDSGLRWHVRAYDKKSKSFRDFVLTRITKVTNSKATVERGEDKLDDHQWMRMVPLQIIPHPNNVEYPEAIRLDFGMVNGELELNVRAAMAGYLLRRWNVDCTENALLSGPEYQLYLKNNQALYGAENLTLAPGYESKGNI